MDLTAAISNLQTSKVMAQVQTGVSRKILQAQQQAGASALQLLAAAGKCQNSSAKGVSAGDALVAQATGLGGSVDTYA